MAKRIDAANPMLEFESYSKWLATVPAVERESLASVVMGAQVDSFSGIGSLAKSILAEVVRGKISPGVARLALEFSQFMFTSVAAEAAISGTGRTLHGSAIAELEDIATKTRMLQDEALELATIDLPPEAITTNSVQLFANGNGLDE